MQKKRIKVTQEELDALTDASGPYMYGGIDRGFKFRMLYLLVSNIVWVARLLFFTTEVMHTVRGMQTAMASDVDYLKLRAYAAIVVMTVYFFSYLRNWLFPQVSLAVVSLAVAGLGMDFVVFYMYFDQPVSFKTWTYIVLSCVAIGCLFFNALNAQRAPPMPRQLWS